MFDIGNHKKVFDELCLALRRAPENKSRTRRMSYKAMPYDNTLTYKGVGLAEVMVPPMTDSLHAYQAAFDLIVENTTSMKHSAMDGVSDLVAPHVVEWLGNWPDPMDKAIMLVWAAGISSGLSVEYDDSSILVDSGEVRFGILNRQVVSRFNSGQKFSIRPPEKLLKNSNTVRTFSSRLIALYREAYRDSEAATNAFLAMVTAYPTIDMWGKARSSVVKQVASSSSLQRWEKIITKHADPIGSIYRVLYPAWMSRAQFSGVFGPLSSRNRDPSPLIRQRLISRMYHHFYKNKEGQQ